MPMAYGFRLLLKWFGVTATFSLCYSLIDPFLNFTFDITAIFSICYALFLIFFEAFEDYTYEFLYKIKGYLRRIVDKLINKLESNPKTIKEAEKIKDIAKKKDLLPHERLYNQEEIEQYYEDVKKEQERNKKHKENKIFKSLPA